MMQENEQNRDDALLPAEQSVGFLTRLFTGWGVPGSVARILAGAVLGALSALWAVAQSGCTAEWRQEANGDVFWRGRVELPPARVLTIEK